MNILTLTEFPASSNNILPCLGAVLGPTFGLHHLHITMVHVVNLFVSVALWTVTNVAFAGHLEYEAVTHRRRLADVAPMTKR